LRGLIRLVSEPPQNGSSFIPTGKTIVFSLFPASIKSNLRTLSIKYLLNVSCAVKVIDAINKKNETIVLIANLFWTE
jgi:hypothetical protein